MTSLNLYEFSQVNNNEMGILLSRDEDSVVYREAFEEAQRLIRVSEEVLDEIQIESDESGAESVVADLASDKKISSSRIAKKHKMKTNQLLECCVNKGYLEKTEAGHCLTDTGNSIGAELRKNKKYGDYFVWPEDLSLS